MNSISEEEGFDNNEIDEEFNQEPEKMDVEQPEEKKGTNIEKEKKIKPHEKVIPDFTKEFLPGQEETGEQAPLVVVVQGSKNVSFKEFSFKNIFR